MGRAPWRGDPVTCRCGKEHRQLYKDGVCSACRARDVRRGDYIPKPTAATRETLAEYEWLRDAGETRFRCAERLGMDYESLYQLLYRMGYRYDRERRAFYYD